MQTIAEHLKTALNQPQGVDKIVAQVTDASEVLSGTISNILNIEPAAGPEVCVESTLRIPAPEAGSEKAYLVNPGTEVVLEGIALADTTRTVEGGNLIIQTPNGSKIILLDYVNSADVENCEANLKGGPRTMADKLNDIEPAAGEPLPVITSNGGGFQVPGVMGGVGSGEGIFSDVIGPYGLTRGTDSIKTEEPFVEPGPNTPPVVSPKPIDAVDDSATVKENCDCTVMGSKSVTINVLGNDTDSDGSVRPLPAEISAFTQAANGTVVRNANGTFTYTPTADYVGQDSFTYTVTNQDGSTDTATVRITVEPSTVDARDDSASITRTTLSGQGQVVINVKANDVDPEGDMFSVTRVVTQPARGTATLNADGTITYVADASFKGSYTTTFTYEVTDTCGATDTATVTVTVGACPTPKAVDAVDDSATVKENCDCTVMGSKSVTINVLGNDTDSDGSVRPLPAEISAFTQAANGTVVKNANGTFTYTPTADYVGQDSFTYTVTNQDGSTDTATVRITVEPSTVDARDDSASITRTTLSGQGQVVINVKANDVDPEGDMFSVTRVVTQPARGTATLNADGTITYVADASFKGSYTTTFTYEVTDTCGATDTATVTVTVGACPTPKAVDAVDDSATVKENCDCTVMGSKSVTINVLGNDTDSDGSVRPLPAEISAFTQAANGTVVRNANGTFTYTPTADYVGQDSFTYTVTNQDGSTDTATVRITVEPSTVDARDDSASITRTTLSGQGQVVINVKANDVDPEGDMFSVTRVVTQPARGTATLNADGTITYVADASFKGSYTTTFTYEVTDTCGATDTATVTVTVGACPTPKAVDAVDDSATVKENCDCTVMGSKSVTINVLGNDTDSDGSVRPLPAEISAFTQAANGTVVRNANGTFTYTPTADYVGQDSFTYTVTNQDGSTDTATVRITVEPSTVDARDDSASITRTTLSGQGQVVINVKANDVDPEGDMFSVTRVVTQPARGTATLNADGTITYVADASFKGSYTTTFTYEVTDTCGATDTATVTVTVGACPTPKAVDAVDDSATVKENCDCTVMGSKSVTINVLGNDTDSDGSVRPLPAEISAFTQAANGTVVRNANGTFTYTPTADYVGQDSFTYTVTNQDGSTDTATVRITVEPSTVDARDDSASITRTTLSGQGQVVINVKANDVDPEGDMFSVTRVVTQPARGTATLNADGTITYVADASFKGSYTTTFTYEVTDTCGATDTATVTVTVGACPTPKAVDAVDDSATVKENCDCTVMGSKSVTINVLGNDTDSDGSVRPLPAEITSFTNPSNGTVVRNANGTFTYTPTADYVGQDSFTYTVTNQDGSTDTATVRITVEPSTVDARDDSATINRSENNRTPATIIRVLSNDVDAEGDIFSITRVTQPAIGRVVQNADGTVTYIPDARSSAYTTTFTYTITDTCGATDTATVTVRVNGYTITPERERAERPDNGCPLVIDLDGNGIGVISNAASNVRFDINGNGEASQTAWFSGTDGVLVRDTNGNGEVDDIHEMFNNINDVNGFAMLARTMDGNNDGVVNAQDAGWNQLQVWVDADQNGLSTPAELMGLDAAGIKSIETTATDTAIYYEGAYMPVASVVHMNDGSSRVIGDVFFTNTHDGEVHGASTNDMLVYSQTATTYNGEQGTDTLWLQGGNGQALSLGGNQEGALTLQSVEALDARNGQADTLNLNLADVLSFNEDGLFMVRGDAVDSLTLSNATRGADVVQNGETFASYTSANGAELLVAASMQVTLEEHRCATC